MKKTILFVAVMFISGIAFSQFNPTGPFWAKFGRTNASWFQNVRAIGIGNFTSFPNAALHVNANLLIAPNSPTTMFTPGQVFRTDGPSDKDNMWQIYTGPDATATEKARLYIPSNTEHFSLQSSIGDMIFNTGGSIQRMRIMGNNGFVAIGQAFNNPVSLLHIDGTNDNTGEVFKTNTLNGLNTFWRMWRADKPIGNVFSRANGESIDRDNFSIQATAKDITFHTQLLDVNNDGIGEERMRIVGLEHDFAGVTVNPGNVGIGTQHPTQKIDVNGNARLRDLPNIQNENLTKCVVVDDDGVLYWRDITDLSTSGYDWDWEHVASGVFSGHSNPLFNENSVYIGVNPQDIPLITDIITVEDNCEKFGVFHNEGSHNVTGAALSISAVFINEWSPALLAANNYSIYSKAIGEGTHNYGAYFVADNSQNNYAGFFETPALSTDSYNYAVYSKAPLIENSFAGYFDGNVNVDGDLTIYDELVSTSDQQFKQNINNYNEALTVVRELNPVTFTFDTVNFDLNLSSGLKYGFISQEVEQHIPELVKTKKIPAKYDSFGDELSPELDFKALNYIGLIPITIGAVKELDSNFAEIVRVPEPPVLISPKNNDTVYATGYETKVSSFSQFFTWHTADDALCYIADYSYTADMSDVFRSQVIFDTILNMGFPYQHDTVIYWAVKSVGAFGLSEYSAIRNFILHYTYKDNYTKSISELSDITLKTNVNNIEDALNKTTLLQGVSFEWDIAENPGRNFNEGTNLGLIAQEVQQIFPEVVSSDINGYLYIDYSSLVPVLVESVKELKYINDSLSASVNTLENRLNNLEQFVFDNLGENQTKNINDPTFQQEVSLENTKAIVLNQNHPNPFKEQTTISFLIPDNIASAKIIFIDNLGNVLKQVEINDRGFGELIVYAHDLSAGHYTYYLIADGKTIESKKMVLTK